MSVPCDLTEKIEETRITYPERTHGVTIDGAPFLCEFDEPVNPEAFCDTVRTEEAPWHMFGVKSKVGDEYWNVIGNLFHVENEEVIDASKISLEVCPDWVRIYVKKDCSAERAAEFVKALNDRFSIDVIFPDLEEANSEG